MLPTALTASTAMPAAMPTAMMPAASFFDGPAAFLDTVSGYLYGQLLAWLLIAAGIWFTVRTRALQLRLFGAMLSAITGSRGQAEGGISSFQAFTIGLASRVGTGNIVGVALAITLGGPGAVFWMWVVALVGMATGFIESTLAQMYKIRHPEGTFRGGPAYYITRGLGSRRWACVFAVVITFVFGFAYEATQANAIAGVMKGTFGVEPWVTAVVLVLITAPVIFSGITGVAKVAEWMAPVMAGVYALMALVVLALNIDAIPGALWSIIEGAFGLNEAVAGIAGGVTAAALNGIKRGLFSNEAGEGSVPNAAATATVAHPVQQGLIQSLGVFVDTILVCTATALIVLLSGVYTPEGTMALAEVDPQAAKDAASTLTSESIGHVLGGWAEYLMAAVIFVFAYSSLLGNYTYAQVNMDFLRGTGHKHYGLRTMIVVATVVGSVASLTFVWNLSDVVMGLMAIINIVAIVLLGRWAFGALADWEDQRRRLAAGEIEEIRFVAEDNPHLPGDLPGDVWSAQNAGRPVGQAAADQPAQTDPVER